MEVALVVNIVKSLSCVCLTASRGCQVALVVNIVNVVEDFEYLFQDKNNLPSYLGFLFPSLPLTLRRHPEKRSRKHTINGGCARRTRQRKREHTRKSFWLLSLGRRLLHGRAFVFLARGLVCWNCFFFQILWKKGSSAKHKTKDTHKGMPEPIPQERHFLAPDDLFEYSSMERKKKFLLLQAQHNIVPTYCANETGLKASRQRTQIWNWGFFLQPFTFFEICSLNNHGSLEQPVARGFLRTENVLHCAQPPSLPRESDSRVCSLYST